MKKWILNLSLVLVLPFGIVLLDGCYPQDSISVGETDIVMTAYRDVARFDTLKTYFMSDTVVPVREDTTDLSLIEYNDQIIAAIARNMEAYGYERLTDPSENNIPDVIVASVAFHVTTVSVGWWYPYYPGWGWGWYKASRETEYYYPGYPGYYPPGYWGGYPYYSSYTTGTLLMEMVNPLDIVVVEGDSVVPIYWAGALNGVLSSSSDVSRITKGIDQAFEQSPQIKAN